MASPSPGRPRSCRPRRSAPAGWPARPGRTRSGSVSPPANRRPTASCCGPAWPRRRSTPTARAACPTPTSPSTGRCRPATGSPSLVASGSATARYADAHSVHVVAGGLAAGRRLLLPLPRPGPHLAGRAHPHRTGGRHRRPRPGDGVRVLRALRVAATTPRTGGWPRTGPDLVLHLGDYIYEGGAGHGRRARSTSAPRSSSLADYRRRYALYKSDPDLQAAHAAAPWLVVPDDHEVENNYASTVRADNSPGADRRAVDGPAHRRLPAYYENMPLRPASAPSRQQHPALPPGALGQPGHLPHARHPPVPRRPGLRRRLEGLRRRRPGQPHASPARPRRPGCSTASASTSAPGTSSGQQVFFARQFDAAGRGQHGRLGRLPRLPRPRSSRAGSQRGVRNPVVLTGDVHRAWANDLKADYANPSSATIGTELVCTSIASGGNGIRRHHHPERGDQPAPEVLLRPARLRPYHDRADPDAGRLPRRQPRSPSTARR